LVYEWRRYQEEEQKADQEFLKDSKVRIPYKFNKKKNKKKEKIIDGGDFYKLVNETYPRWVSSAGPLQGKYVYWIDEINGKMTARCTDSLKSKKDEEDFTTFDVVPKEIEWMYNIYKNGIKWWGRKEHQYDDVKRNYKKNCIAEVLTSTAFKYKERYVDLYLVRFCGENMGSAAWMRRCDLQGCEKMIKEFEKEKLLKGDKLDEYDLRYNGLTSLKCPKTKNFEFIENKQDKKRPKALVDNKICKLQPITKNEPVKNTRFTMIYNQHEKNRIRDKKANQLKMFDETSCIFHSINSLYQLWPKRALQILCLGNCEKWKDIKNKIKKCLEKYSPKFTLSILYQRENMNGTLFSNISKLEFLKEIDCIVGYRAKNTFTGHAGVLQKGKIQKIKIFQYEARKKLNKENYILETQEKLKEDMKSEITELIIFVINEKK